MMATALIVSWALLALRVMHGSFAKEVFLNGAGASFPSIVYCDWITLYSESRSHFVNVATSYQRIGSGAGLAMIERNAPTANETLLVYAASDAGMTSEERARFPELVMFPSLAGAVVFIYNLPSIDSLVLDRNAIADIFLGRIRVWNDSALRQLNPGLSLPNAQILRSFRDDVSGTTDMLTTALSSFSSDWATLYGVSSRPTWPTKPEEGGGVLVKNAVSMAGYVALNSYSFGYLSLSDAETLQSTYATMINKAGNKITGANAIAIGVQEAMEYYHRDQESSGLTQSITDAPTPRAYPVAAYTYLVVNTSTSPAVSCDQMIEFVRYAIWFFNDAYAQQVARMNSMIIVSENISKAIIERVLQRITCNGENVYNAVMRQIDDENRPPALPKSDLSPSLIILISCLCLICVSLPVVFYFYYRHRAMKEAINKKEWLIDPAEFRIGDDDTEPSSRVVSNSVSATHLPNSENGLFTTVAWERRDGLAMLYHCKQHPCDSHLSHGTLRFIVKCRKQIDHDNVARWLGITVIDKALYQVYSVTDRRTLHNALTHSPYKLNNEVKLSIASAIANGVDYLHQHGIVHGNLSTWTCLLDSNWTIKVACWAESTMLETERLLRPAIDGRYETLLSYTTNALMRMAFVHPDLLVGNQQKTNALSKLTPNFDAYSFGVMLIEIGTRTPIWSSKSASVGWARCVYDHCRGNDMLAEMFNSDGRDRMSVGMTQLASQLLRTDGSSLGFASISRTLKKALRWNGRSIVDILMSAVEEHANALEEVVRQKSMEVDALKNEMESLLNQTLPPAIALQLGKGALVDPELFDSCTILFANITSFARLASELMPYQVVKTLNTLCSDLDHVISQFDDYRVETFGDYFMIASGLPKRNGDLHAREIALTALAMLDCVRNFVIDYMPRRKLAVRLGASTGPVIAGVIGAKFPRYCLFGDTVSTASIMEFTSLQNQIQVSNKTADYLRPFAPEFFVKERGMVDGENRGSLPSYWLVRTVADKRPSQCSGISDVERRDYKN